MDAVYGILKVAKSLVANTVQKTISLSGNRLVVDIVTHKGKVSYRGIGTGGQLDFVPVRSEVFISDFTIRAARLDWNKEIEAHKTYQFVVTLHIAGGGQGRTIPLNLVTGSDITADCDRFLKKDIPNAVSKFIAANEKDLIEEAEGRTMGVYNHFQQTSKD